MPSERLGLEVVKDLDTGIFYLKLPQEIVDAYSLTINDKALIDLLGKYRNES